MGYIDAGYAIALFTLAAYSVGLWQRRRRLERQGAAQAGGSPRQQRPSR